MKNLNKFMNCVAMAKRNGKHGITKKQVKSSLSSLQIFDASLMIFVKQDIVKCQRESKNLSGSWGAPM